MTIDDSLSDQLKSDSPEDIVKYLVQEFGHDGAVQAVIEGVGAAHKDGDNYALSVWREVKGLLREQEQ
jgi:hypothetical protein